MGLTASCASLPAVYVSLLSCTQGQGPATALPAALLANVLALLGQSCLQSAALVNSTWHAASVLAVSSIQVSSLDPSKAAALSGYLKAHAATANISSIEVQTGGSSCHSSESLNVQFPFMKSPLQSLKLNGMFMVNAAAATADNMFVDDEYIAHDASIGQHFMFNSCLGGPCASSLTQLDIASTQLYLSGLEDLTSLQRLSVVAGNFPAGLLRDNFLVLSMGLHHLQQLTSLRLGDYYTSAVPWSQLSGLTSLRELMLGAVNSGRLTFPEGSLPTSLTRFRVSAMCSSRDQLMFTAATATALAQLTALLVLELRTVGHVHVALLSALVHLQRLVISEGHQSTNGTLAAGPDEPRLSALTALTELQHLQLPALNDAQPAAVDAADFAAITASPQLTFLRFDLSPPKWTVSNGLSAADVPKVFAAQRQLLNLRHLVGLAGWLGHDGTAADPQHFGDRVPCLGHVVRCCPNLQQLVLQYDASVPELAHWDISSGILQLAGLMELTRLDIDFSEGDVMTAFGILAKLTGLQDLVLRDFSDKYGQDVLVLTTLKAADTLEVQRVG